MQHSRYTAAQQRFRPANSLGAVPRVGAKRIELVDTIPVAPECVRSEHRWSDRVAIFFWDSRRAQLCISSKVEGTWGDLSAESALESRSVVLSRTGVTCVGGVTCGGGVTCVDIANRESRCSAGSPVITLT